MKLMTSSDFLRTVEPYRNEQDRDEDRQTVRFLRDGLLTYVRGEAVVYMDPDPLNGRPGYWKYGPYGQGATLKEAYEIHLASRANPDPLLQEGG